MRKATLKAICGSTVTASRIDWLTLTSQTDERSDALWRLGDRLCTTGEQEGELPTRWHAHGYRGASIAGVAYGARADGCYLRLSGEKSAQHWLEALTASENCSRIDLAVDTHLDFPVCSVVAELYHKIPDRSSHGGRPPMRKLVRDTRGGQTLYFGSRTSERFGRVYDKGIESKSHGAGQRWRWELEAKERCAKIVAAGVARAASAESYIQGVVAGFFHSRCGVSIAEISRLVINNETPERPRAERLLQWLAIGVRPTVGRLIEVYGRDRVLTALGIPPKSAVAAASGTAEPEE